MSPSGKNDGARVPDQDLKAWVGQRLEAAVNEIGALGLHDAALLEAVPAWVFPFTLLIGKVREHGQTRRFDWFICGDGPLTVAESKAARTPREAARHFALKWQLDAARQGDAGEDLARKASALYELVAEDSLWP